jgi:putative endonuclease
MSWTMRQHRHSCEGRNPDKVDTVPAYVYIMASGRNGTLYIGVTTNLPLRVAQHKTGSLPGFTDRYKVHLLVYFELHEDIREAIAAEKRIKRWKRSWKIRLIELVNPEWKDLSESF